MLDIACLEQFLSRFDGEKHLKMLDVYIMSFHGHKQSCLAAVSAQDIQALQKAAHDLKSLFLMLEDTESGALALEIESQAKTGDVDVSGEAVKHLMDAIDQALKIMQGRKDRLTL